MRIPKVTRHDVLKKVFYLKILLISESNNTNMQLEIKNSIDRFLPQISFRFIFNNQLIIEIFSFFKDRIPNVLQGCVVYNFSCGQFATCGHALQNMQKYLLEQVKPYQVHLIALYVTLLFVRRSRYHFKLFLNYPYVSTLV